MFSRVKKPEVKKEIVYRVIEVPQLRTPLQGGKEAAESVQALAGMPGFQYLLHKLSRCTDALQARYNQERHTTLESVYFLQAGIFWSKWLATELDRSSVKATPAPSDAMIEEAEAFRLIDEQLERVGM